MELTFLGTGSAYPSPHRGASCIVLRNEGVYWMFDCGEGSQTQLMKSSLRAGRICKIFITHLHGDHMFGLPGLMCTLSLKEGKQNLQIYGPQGLRKFIRTSLELSRSMLGYEYEVHELVPVPEQQPQELQSWPIDHSSSDTDLHPNETLGSCITADNNHVWHLFEDDTCTVKASWHTHRVASYGYVVEEKPLPGKLNIDILKKKGVKPGPLYFKIKNGESIEAADGTLINPSDVIGPPKLGRKVAIFGDTSDSAKMEQLCEDVTVLVHEATLENSMRELCIEKGHSTPEMAGTFAKKVNAEHLVLTHFSQRYKAETSQIQEGDAHAGLLQEQAKESFCSDNVTVMADFGVFTVPGRKLQTLIDKTQKMVTNWNYCKCEQGYCPRNHVPPPDMPHSETREGWSMPSHK